MAKEFDRTNTGALFVNDKKTSEKHPTYKGSLNVGGVEYWVSGWVKEAKSSGQKFVSLSVERKDGEGQRKAANSGVSGGRRYDDDFPS